MGQPTLLIMLENPTLVHRWCPKTNKRISKWVKISASATSPNYATSFRLNKDHNTLRRVFGWFQSLAMSWGLFPGTRPRDRSCVCLSHTHTHISSAEIYISRIWWLVSGCHLCWMWSSMSRTLLSLRPSGILKQAGGGSRSRGETTSPDGQPIAAIVTILGGKAKREGIWLCCVLGISNWELIVLNMRANVAFFVLTN